MVRNIVFALSIACFLPGTLARGATTTPAAASGQFPAIEATNLDHTRLNLPGKFAGQMNLVIIFFTREQQHEVNTWIHAARQIESSHGKFRYYELLTMSRENLLYRWWFNGSMRSDTVDKNLRSRILTAYVDKNAFKKSLHIAKEKQVVAVLVDQKGRVYWREDGAYVDQDKIQLLSVLAANGL